MGNFDFLLICVLSLAFVFLLLSILSLTILLITIIFPEKSQDDDSAVIAAITTHLSRAYPKLHIKKIEGIK